MKAKWKNRLIAESDDTIVVENNYYFPLSAVNQSFLVSSDTQTTCPWKGKASYYSIAIDGEQLVDAAWYYPNPKPAAENIKDYVAFWKGVAITT
ncbi:MAG: DUF427 domain-containing protein [Sphingobacteriaceae bacterium]